LKRKLLDVADQRESLEKLAKLTEKAILHPRVNTTAKLITDELDARDDMAELEALFDAVKTGTDKVPGLANGIRYVADPRLSDLFTAPNRTLELAAKGAGSGDCDDAASLMASLAGTLGFRVGLRAWGPGEDGEFVHVYAVAGVPKRNPRRFVGLDTTVETAKVGWEPPGGHTMTAVLE
jgi:hypothetical protein